MLLPEVDLSPVCRLVHYTRELVPVYHSWFEQYPQLLQLTASEPLTLQEELDNQQSWILDKNKVTYIILDSTDNRPVGDVNCFISEDHVGELNVMIAVPSARRKGLARIAIRTIMQTVNIHCPEITRFIAKIDAENIPSRTMFEKLGFKLTKTLPVFNEAHYEVEYNR